MSHELETAIVAARAAGDLLRGQLGAAHQIRHKGPTDLVTEMDRRAEDLIASLLQKAFPAYGLVGEESGERHAPGGARWLVDPLDGTTNYARGYPFFAVSIALERDGEIVIGVVYNPMLDELFTAERGGGATLNGRPIHVSATANLGASLLVSGFPYDAWTNDADNARNEDAFQLCQPTMPESRDGGVVGVRVFAIRACLYCYGLGNPLLTQRVPFLAEFCRFFPKTKTPPRGAGSGHRLRTPHTITNYSTESSACPHEFP